MVDRAPSVTPLTDTVGYVRVSTEEQAGDKASPVQQRAAIAQLAGALGRDVGRMFEDLGVSGGTGDGRPGFMAMLSWCEGHPRPRRAPGLVLLLNHSRFGRFARPSEYFFWSHRFERAGWLLRYAEGDVETRDPATEVFLHASHSVASSAWRETVKANAKRGGRAAALQGRWLTAAPIGYRRCASRAGRPDRILEHGQRKAPDETVRLVLGPLAEQDLIRDCFTRYAAGSATITVLLEELLARWPQRRWSRGGVNALLHNVTYTGAVVWGRRPNDVDEKREQPVRPAAAWVVVPNAHPALIPPALFEVVQARLARNAHQVRARGDDVRYPLSHLVVCSRCGMPFVGGGGGRGPVHDPDSKRVYVDKGAYDDGVRRATCPRPSITVKKQWLEAAIVREIARWTRTPAARAAVEAELDAQLAQYDQATGPRRATLERDRTRLGAERDRLIAAVARGLLEDAEAAAAIGRIRTELEEITTVLERLRFDDRRSQVTGAAREQLLTLALDFEALAARADGAQLREIVRPWLQRAVIDKQRRTLQIEIRRIPAMLPFLALTSMAQPGSQRQSQRIIRRTLHLPPSQRAAKRQSA